MTAPLTAERLAEVRARVSKATEGPWEVDQAGQWGDRDTVVPAGPRREACYVAALGGDEESQVDAEFIAHARSDVPDLLAEVERLTERAEKAEGALARVEARMERWDGLGLSGLASVVRAEMEGKP